MSDSSEYDLELKSDKFIDVGAIPENLDVHAVPTCGLDYLRQVRLELSRCPQVVRVELDEKKMRKASRNQTAFQGAFSYLTPAPPGFAPTSQFNHEQETEFSNLRDELLKVKPMLQKKYPKKAYIPNIKDAHAWHHFCFGRKSSEVGKEQDERLKGSPPLLSSIMWMMQPDVEILLSYHLEWLHAYGFSHEQGCWIYCLMVLLEKPLTPNACDVLRKIAHTCSVLRSKLKSKHDLFLPGLNLIICLVSRYFDQRDMDDEIEKIKKDREKKEEEEEDCDFDFHEENDADLQEEEGSSDSEEEIYDD